jgi:hypothetical protein
MHWLYILILAFIGFSTLAMMIREGLWNNTVTIMIHVFSGLTAFAFYGQTARFLDETATNGTYTYWMDFLSMWALYVVIFIVLRLVTNMVSKERVRFKMPVEWTGSIISAILGAYLMSGFVGAIMHTVMLPADFLGSAILAESREDVELKLSRPDIAWLRLYGAVATRVMPSASAKELIADTGPMNRAAQPYTETFIPPPPVVEDWGDVWARLFILQYKDRRAKFAAAPGLRVNRGGSQ